jgi:S-formylglutathione hydrolase FrmB
VVGVVVALAVSVAAPVSADAAPATGCAAPNAPVVVGQVACKTVTTHMLGNGIAAPFAYYVPPECDPARRVRCPVLYLLHGFGGDYTEMVGTPAAPSAWVSALTKAPPAGFESSPWTHADPGGWRPARHMPMILVAPRGQTLPNGYGPAPGLDSYWTDWNPRYALGGDQPQYATPPPRFTTYLVSELVPFVETHFPTGTGREWRAIGGVSLGGFGAYKNGLQHPDAWTSMLSVSGAHNFLFAPGLDPRATAARLHVSPPVPLPFLPLPGLTQQIPTAALPPQASTFLTALPALGDPVADQAYFRGNTPRDLAMNGHAIGIDGFVNDTIPRRQEDVGDVTSQAFEDVVFPMNVDMQLAFHDEHVRNTFAVHQGLHSDAYRNAWFRGLEEFAYARLHHLDGGGAPPRPPTSFDYRTVAAAFSIWGWRVQVDRQAVEFLTLRQVSCRSITAQGSGVVTVTVPASCHTGMRGRSTFTIDLGPGMPASDPAGLGSLGQYGQTKTVRLRPNGR